jgi:mannose-6-phosphate isomerase-like protein (cupin superfamily)
MVSASLRRIFVGSAAVVTSLGWLQLAPAFGAPVTAPAGMLDRLLGADREAGPIGWALLVIGEAAIVTLYFLVVERRSRRLLAPMAFALGAWFVSGAVVMPLVGALQGTPPPGALPNDPMSATFFMLNLGVGAAAAGLIGWLLFGAVLAAGGPLKIGAAAFSLAISAAVLAAVVALAVPTLAASAGADRVVEGRLDALPAGAFISVLELPQPPGAVLGPHRHVAGFVADVSGTATMVAAGTLIDVGPGGASFIGDQVLHDHENRAAVPVAIALAVMIVALTIAFVLRRGRRSAVALAAVLLVVSAVATIDPFMNHWYFVAVRPAVQRGAAMPVPAGHRTYESAALTGLVTGPQRERLTDQRLGAGTSARFAGPGAIVVLDGEISVLVDGQQSSVSAQAGTTIAGGTEATVQSRAGGARILVVQLIAGP